MKRLRINQWKLTLAAILISSQIAVAAQTLRPRADGTIADGGVFGAFDGVPDDWDFFFNNSSYEGAITLTTQTPESSLEHRLIFEYDLSAVTYAAPLTARLEFVLRGAPVFPADNADVQVYVYPADLLERASDFSVEPATLAGSVQVAPYAPPTTLTLNVSGPVNALLLSGTRRIGFRFQINPQTPHANNQAFMDATDAEPETKPALILEDVLPGDGNGDRVVDLTDFTTLSTCVRGPGMRTAPNCLVFDLDGDRDVDHRDVAMFVTYFSPAP